jgi:hypothetical protein
LELISLKSVQALLLSNYGGLLLVPVWFGCVVCRVRQGNVNMGDHRGFDPQKVI